MIEQIREYNVLKKKIPFFFCIVLLFFACGTVCFADRQVDLPDGLPVPVLMYHDFSSDAARWSNMVISPERFEADIRTMLAMKLTPISLSEYQALVQAWQQYKSGATSRADFDALVAKTPSPILITMDDGYRSWYDVVFPLVRKYNIKINGFLFAAAIDDATRYPYDRKFITWEEAREMQDSGLVEFGNHSYILHNQTLVTTLQMYNDKKQEEKIIADMEKGHAAAEQNGIVYQGLAYPYGIYNSSIDAYFSKTYPVRFCTKQAVALLHKYDAPLPRFNRLHGPDSHAFMRDTGFAIYRSTGTSFFRRQYAGLIYYTLYGHKGNVIVFDKETFWLLDASKNIGGRTFTQAVPGSKTKNGAMYTVGQSRIELSTDRRVVLRNGTPLGALSTPVTVQDKTLYFPLRNVYEILGYVVSYNATTREVVVIY